MSTRSACTWPSSEEPAPNGTTGGWKRWLILTDLDDLFGGGGEADDVGRGGGVVRLALAVMLAHGGGVRRARAEERLEIADRFERRGGRGHPELILAHTETRVRACPGLRAAARRLRRASAVIQRPLVIFITLMLYK